MRRLIAALSAGWLGLSAAPTLSASSAELATIERGRAIYERGISSHGNPITAVVGERSIELPGDALPCGSCHGADGRGRPEAGVTPPRITWRYLTRHDGHHHLASGRRHPAFTLDSLHEALTQGQDPAGHSLDAAMPRYRMEHQDFEDLAAYLKAIDYRQDPGVGDDWLRLATILPSSGPYAPLGQWVLARLVQRFAQINRQGGIYGRQLELVVVDSGDGGLTSDELNLGTEPVFALLTPLTKDAGTRWSVAVADDSIPVIAPISLGDIASAARTDSRESAEASRRGRLLQAVDTGLDRTLEGLTRSGRSLSRQKFEQAMASPGYQRD